MIMATLAGIGLHALLSRWIGQRWFSLPMLVMWIASFWIWTSCYLVATRADQLLANAFYRIQADGRTLVEHIGARLLAPVQKAIPSSEEFPDQVSARVMLQALRATPEAEYLENLQEHLQPDVPRNNASGWLKQGVYSWLTARRAGWPLLSESEAVETLFAPPVSTDAFTLPFAIGTAPKNTAESITTVRQTRFLIDMLASLAQQRFTIENANTDTEPSLSAVDWHRLVGARLVSHIYGPVAVEALTWIAKGIAATLLVLQLIWLGLAWPVRKGEQVEEETEEFIEETYQPPWWKRQVQRIGSGCLRAFSIVGQGTGRRIGQWMIKVLQQVNLLARQCHTLWQQKSGAATKKATTQTPSSKSDKKINKQKD